MSRKQTILKGAFILTFTGVISRLIGFYQRMFLSQTFGAEGMGLYQLIFPVYALCLSLTTAGIETAISRTVSAKITVGQREEAKQFLLSSMLLSFILSIICSVGLVHLAHPIAINFLGDERTYDLLLLLAYTFPFASIHGCIVGYYFGLKQTLVPSIAQLIEQLVRVGSIFIMYQICLTNHASYSISLAVIGMILGEAFSTIFVVFCITGRKEHLGSTKINPRIFRKQIKILLPLSAPLTGNRIALNLLHSIEAISIPRQLLLFGMSNSQALSTYGILTGMALPCLLFPTAITSALSTMLLPTVAEIQAMDNTKEIKFVVGKTVEYCTYLGILCLIFFFVFSDMIGTNLFHNEEVGSFLRVMAWLCPFLYMNTTLLSILNGLGKPMSTFTINCIGLIIRIASILIFIPVVGIHGYLWGMLLSQIFVTFGCFWSFKKLDVM